MRIVVGLGNPGEEYAGTRHNVGFDVVDRLARRLRIEFRSRGGSADVADGRALDAPCLLVKPMTYMNRSGGPLRKVLDDLGGSLADVLVVVDDFELELGRLRIRRSGSDGGHNGLKSIISTLGAEFARLRVGIGPPPGRMPVEVFVLKPFRSDERDDVDWMLDRAADAAEAWVRGAEIQSLMNEYNRRPPNGALC